MGVYGFLLAIRDLFAALCHNLKPSLERFKLPGNDQAMTSEVGPILTPYDQLKSISWIRVIVTKCRASLDI